MIRPIVNGLLALAFALLIASWALWLWGYRSGWCVCFVAAIALGVVALLVSHWDERP